MKTHSMESLIGRFSQVRIAHECALESENGHETFTPDTLKPPVNPQLRQLIDRPQGEDRSKDMIKFVFAMVRYGYSDDQIRGILRNPANPISAHALDQADPERAILRAIKHVRSELDPAKAFGEAASLPPGTIPASVQNTGTGKAICATPYRFRGASEIRPRDWIFGHSLLRGSLSLLVAPGASGKTALTMTMAVALATGRDVLGTSVWGGPKNIWLWNLEDNIDELHRSLLAAALHWQVSGQDLEHHLYLDSGLSGDGLILASMTREGASLDHDVVEALVAELIVRGIDVLIIDPFVSSHRVAENDTMAMDLVAKEFAKVAVRANCAILLVHHTRKLSGGENNAEAARGSISLVNAARSVSTINRMTKDEAQRFGISDEERRRYFRIYDDKNNRAPPAVDSDWYRLVSVDIGNGVAGGKGDNMPVVEPWTPYPFRDDQNELTDEIKVQIQEAVRDGEWRWSDQAGEQWVGRLVASILGLACSTKLDRARIRAALDRLCEMDVIVIERRNDKGRRERPFVVAGRWERNTATP